MTAPRDETNRPKTLADFAFHAGGCSYWRPPNNRPANDRNPETCDCGYVAALLTDQQPVAWRWRTKDRIHGFPTKWMLVETNPKADSQFAEVAAMPDVEIELFYTHPVTVTPAMIERAARAACESLLGDTGRSWRDLTGDEQRYFRERAERILRAALEEPV